MKNLLFLAFTVTLFAGIFACGKQDGGQSAVAKNGTPQPYSYMDPEKAQTAINAWRTMRAGIVSELDSTHFLDTNYVARGFHVPLDDLRRILDNIGDTTQLFAMLAVQDSADNPTKPMLTLIFQAPDKEGHLKYYDFTLPCPKQCPQND